MYEFINMQTSIRVHTNSADGVVLVHIRIMINTQFKFCWLFQRDEALKKLSNYYTILGTQKKLTYPSLYHHYRRTYSC